MLALILPVIFIFSALAIGVRAATEEDVRLTAAYLVIAALVAAVGVQIPFVMWG